MKWITLLFSLSLLFTQNKTNEELSISEALLLLSERSGYDISFKSDDELNKEISIDLNENDLLKLLEFLLPKSKYIVRIDHEKKSVIIKRRQVTVSGNILNKTNGNAIPYVNVFLKNQGQGSFTNEHGFFTFLTDRLEKDTLIVTAVGYQSVKKAVSSESELRDLSINLSQKSFVDHVSEVNAFELFRYDDLRHRVTVSNKDLHQAPMSGENDVFENLKYLSDITAGETNNFALSLNSGGIHDNLFLLDGIRLFHSDHYFGNFSVFDGDAISAVTIYPINMPQHYSSVLSGVVELFSNEGNSEKPEFSVSLNAINMNATYGQKIADNFSVFVQARRSVYDYFESDQFNFYRNNEVTTLNSDNKQENIELRFYDLLAKATYTINSKNHLKATYFESGDYNTTKYDDGLLVANDFSLNRRDWENQGRSVSLYSQLSSHSYLTWIYSDTKFNSRIKTNLFIAVNSPSDTLHNYVNAIDYLQSSINYHHTLTPSYQISSGLSYSKFESKYIDKQDESESERYHTEFPEFYMNNAIRFEKNHHIELGAKLSYLKKYEEFHYLPRFSYLWNISSNFRTSLSYSEHTEMIAQQSTVAALSSHIYDRWIATNSLEKRPFAKHWSLTFSYQNDEANSYQLKLYQKKIYNNFINYYYIEEEDITRPNFQNVVYNAIQFTMQSKFNAHLSSQLTYNYFTDDFHHNNVDYGDYVYSRHNLKSMTVFDYQNWRFTLSSKNIFAKQIVYEIEPQFTLLENRKDFMIIDLSALHILNFDDIQLELGAVFKNILDQSNQATKIDPESNFNSIKPLTYISYEEIFQGFSVLFHLKATF